MTVNITERHELIFDIGMHNGDDSTYYLHLVLLCYKQNKLG